MSEALSDEQVRVCIEAAVMAPSLHNTQPWLFQPVANRIEVFADLTRRLPAIDPAGRGMYLSVGAALMNLRLALAAVGRPPVLLQLTPDRADLSHAATVTAGPVAAPSSTDVDLFATIPLRRTSRLPFTGARPAPDELQRLEQAALQQGCLLQFTTSAERDALISLARTAETRQQADATYRAELRAWTTDDPYRDDGVPLASVGPQSLDDALPLRDFAVDRDLPHRDTVPFEDDPVLGVLSVIGQDSPAAWLRAGQALERVLLEATARGLATGLFTQPLELPDLRELLADPTLRTSIQAILRVGHAPHLPPPTPRRPIDDVLMHGPSS